MKINLQKLFLVLAGTGFLALPVAAQTFTNLHGFAHGNDGASPDAGLMQSGNTLYGTANRGGSLGYGTLFAVNTDGTGFTNFYAFTGGSDGAYPQAGLILSGGTLYGTATEGGINGNGTVFAVNTNGTGFTILHAFTAAPSPFTNSDGAYPEAGLILSGGTLFGTANARGLNNNGTVFAVNTNGTGFTVLHAFTLRSGNNTNSDGAVPQAGLILSGSTLYGTATEGGSHGNGTVFAVNTDGTGFTNLHSFTTLYGGQYINPPFVPGTNDEGADPQAGLILSGNTLYGTAIGGGGAGHGAVFAVNTDGSGFTNLHSFGALTFDSILGNLTNSDGANPQAGLILSGGTLYGTASGGGSAANGDVFAVNTDGTDFTNLHNFSAEAYDSINYTNYDGANPQAGLILSGNLLYGTANGGGGAGYGTVFALGLPVPPPAAQPLNLFVSARDDRQIDEFGPGYTNGGPLIPFAGVPIPQGLAFDRAGNLFVSDASSYENCYIAKITPGGVASTFATGLAYPSNLAFDPAGDLFVADYNVIYEYTNGVASERGTFTTLLSFPYGLVFDGAGNLFASDLNTGKIYEFTNGVAGEEGVFVASGLSNPQGLAFDRAGDLFVSDAGLNAIFEYTNCTATARGTFAVNLDALAGLAFDPAGDLFVADFAGGHIYEFTNGVAAEQGTIATMYHPFSLAFAPWPAVPFTYTTNGGAITITGYTGYTGPNAAVIIPGMINNLPVGSIGNAAFYDQTNVASVTLGTNVIVIGSDAFQGCTSLTNIGFPDSVITIGAQAFSGCTGLTNVTMGANISGIGGGAFNDCPGLATVYFAGNAPTPTNDTSVFQNDAGAMAFYLQGAAGWGAAFDGIPTSVILPPPPLFSCHNQGNGTCYISGYNGPAGAVVIPTTINGLLVSTIQGLAFANKGGVTSVTIPDSVTLIGSGAFEFCTSLTNVTIGGGVTEIDNNAFRGCDNLISATFKGNAPPNVGQYVFGMGDIPFEDTNATVYYLAGTTGWSSTFAGLPALPVAAVFTDLHLFTELSGIAEFSDDTNTDGANPYAGVVLAGNTLYGTAQVGGDLGGGAVFAINTDGTGFTNLYAFAELVGGYQTNSYGCYPGAGLLLSGNTLYGTTTGGGSGGHGTIFKVNTDGTGFTNMYSFSAYNDNHSTNSDGAGPQAGLMLSGNTLYGTTPVGGPSRSGTVFAINTDGTGFTNLYGFSATGDSDNNSDGAGPESGLILSGNTMYGTTAAGGTGGEGTVFAINTDGSGFTNLHNFDYLDDSYPYAGLVKSGNTLYGMTLYGDLGGSGAVFAVNTDSTGFTNIYRFTGGNDGGFPDVGLTLLGNTLYGTTAGGGSGGNGTVFSLKTDGSDFTTLYTFSASGPMNSQGWPANGDAADINAVLILSGNTLYGTAEAGGSLGNGTVFSLTLPPVSAPQLTINLSGPNLILTWPTNATGFTLQSTTNLVPPVVWGAVSPAPVVVNTNNAATNAISAAQMYYRLSQ